MEGFSLDGRESACAPSARKMGGCYATRTRGLRRWQGSTSVVLVVFSLNFHRFYVRQLSDDKPSILSSSERYPKHNEL